jgi:hypothetical protein
VQNGHDSHAEAHAHATPADRLSSCAQTHFLDLKYSKLQAIFPRAAHSVD